MNREVLAKIFNQPDLVCNKDSDCKREKFISRLFGIFSEEIVNTWCDRFDGDKFPYKNLGRPSLYDKENDKYTGSTLDFTFQDKDNKIYIVEMKCEIQYQNFKYFYLNYEDELEGFLEHHNKKAFDKFREFPENKNGYIVKYSENSKTSEKIEIKQEDICGIILIWGKVNKDIEYKKNIGDFHQILSVERMISDLIEWDDEKFKRMIAEHQCWSNDMFDQLVGKLSKNDECIKHTESC